MSRKPNPFDEHVGARLKAARTLSGFSQERLGDAVSLSFQQIQKYEKGSNRIGASRLQQFAQILNVPPSYFFDGMPGTEPLPATTPLSALTIPADATDGISRRMALELIRNFSAIRNPLVRDQIYKLIKAVADTGDDGLVDTSAGGEDDATLSAGAETAKEELQHV